MKQAPTEQTTEQTTEQAPEKKDLNTPQARAQATTEYLIQQGRVPAGFVDENGNVNQTHLFQTLLSIEKNEAPSAPAAETTTAVAPADTTVSATKASESDSLSEALSGPAMPQGANPWDLAAKQMREKGAVEDSVLAALKATGATDEALAMMGMGFKAQQKSDMEKAFEVTGGKEGFDATIRWAKDNLKPEELGKIKTGLESEHALLVLSGLHARAKAANAPSGQVNTSAAGVSTIAPGNPNDVRGFESPADALMAQRDAKYGRDPDYTRLVEARIGLMKGIPKEVLRANGYPV